VTTHNDASLPGLAPTSPLRSKPGASRPSRLTRRSGTSFRTLPSLSGFATESVPELWARFRTHGDLWARDALVEHYCYLVRMTAGRVVVGLPLSLDREDLISAGMIGLIRAVDQFDAVHGVKFETYAIALIRGAVLELLRGADPAPRSLRDKVKMLERAYAAIEQRVGRPATEDEVAAELGIDLDRLHRITAEAARADLISLDEMLFAQPGDSLRRVDVVEDESAAGEVTAGVEAAERKKALHKGLKRLPEREQLVLSLYFYEGLTFREIGGILKVSESRVYQLQQQALLRLRGYLGGDVDLFE